MASALRSVSPRSRPALRGRGALRGGAGRQAPLGGVLHRLLAPFGVRGCASASDEAQEQCALRLLDAWRRGAQQPQVTSAKYVISVLCRGGRQGEARSTLELVRKRGNLAVRKSAEVYLPLARYFAVHEQLDALLEVFRESLEKCSRLCPRLVALVSSKVRDDARLIDLIDSWKVPLTTPLMNALLVASQLRGSGGTQAISAAMRRNALRPDARTYKLLMTNELANGNVRGVHAVLSQMLGDPSVARNNYLYSHVIYALAKLGDLEGAKAALGDMSQRGIQPDVRTYCAMAVAYARGGHVDGVRTMHQLALSAPQRWEVRTFRSLIGAYRRLGNLHDAEALLNSMRESRLRVDVKTATTLVLLYGEHGELERARDVFEDVVLHHQRWELDPRFWAAMIEVLGRNGDVSGALKVYQRCNVRRNDAVDAAVLGAQSHSGDAEAFRRLFSAVVGRGARPGPILMRALIAAYGRLGDIDTALKVFDKMLANGMCVDLTTFEAMMEAYGAVGDAAGAEDVFRRLVELRWHPKAGVYGAMVRAYGAAGDALGAVRWFERSIEDGHQPSLASYNSLISSLAAQQHTHEALGVLAELLRSNLAPNHHTFLALLGPQLQHGELQRVYHLFEMLCRAGGRPTRGVYQRLLDGHPNRALLRQCVQTLTAMRLRGVATDDDLIDSLVAKRWEVLRQRELDAFAGSLEGGAHTPQSGDSVADNGGPPADGTAEQSAAPLMRLSES